MSEQTGGAQEPQPTTATAQPDHVAEGRPPQRPFPAQMSGPALASAAERVGLAARRRDEFDYICSYWSALA